MNDFLEGLKFGIGLTIPIIAVTYLCYKFLVEKLHNKQNEDDNEETGFRFIASTIIRPPNVIKCEHICDKCVQPNVENEEND